MTTTPQEAETMTTHPPTIAEINAGVDRHGVCIVQVESNSAVGPWYRVLSWGEKIAGCRGDRAEYRARQAAAKAIG